MFAHCCLLLTNVNFDDKYLQRCVFPQYVVPECVVPECVVPEYLVSGYEVPITIMFPKYAVPNYT